MAQEPYKKEKRNSSTKNLPTKSICHSNKYVQYIYHTHTHISHMYTSVRFKCRSYLCMPACMCVSSIPVRCCSTLCHDFLRVSLSLAAVPSSTSRTTTAAPISRSLLNAFSLFRYCVFCFCYCFFCSFYHNVRAPQQTSPPQNWPIRARHLQRARPRLRRVRAGGWKVGGELGGGIL